MSSSTVQSRPRSRILVLGTIAAAAGALLPLIMLEAFLHYMPVTQPAYAQSVNARTPYLHFLPDRDVTYSNGWRFSIVTRKHVNNYGFASDTDFVRDEQSPLLAIIGDSYVEAWQVPNKQTMHGQLGARTSGRGRVYGIGFSGSPLSQYLAYAEMARKDFSPDGMVFVVVGNDFDESLFKYKKQAGYHYFVDHDGQLLLERIDHAGQSAAASLASKSSLAMYIRHTIGFDFRKAAAALGSSDDPVALFAGNVAVDASTERIQDSKAAVAAFLAQLPERSGLSPASILFVVDAIRPQLYNPNETARAEASYFGQMRRHFIGEARSAGFEVIDMTSAFGAAYARNGKKFEFPADNHWNALGHQIVAEQIDKSTVFTRIFR